MKKLIEIQDEDYNHDGTYFYTEMGTAIAVIRATKRSLKNAFNFSSKNKTADKKENSLAQSIRTALKKFIPVAMPFALSVAF
ncbi:MAG: hypothetical protein COB76_00995 [Alphaproteobacteria bacterium]|nr:MAG: hypothetical protein COB76_00995 [Alphaproteobacteria bacterium]